ncbi:MAG: CheY-like chemotaxis protein [Candidatus Latescibacterota bacterium]|jgi:CheY-like chemotaxis protein
MHDSQQLIDIQEVANTFGKSVESIRKYKNFGIIRVSDKRGNKDLFDREEITGIRSRLHELRLKGLSLAQIADQLDLARAEDLGMSMPTPPSGQPPTVEAGKKLKILVVDDERDVRASLREFLEGLDYAICEAADGEEALAKTFTEKPHLILLDLRLPKLDGYQVCQTLKGNAITSGIPIIMLTALNATPNKIKGIEHGADDYVDKPFDLEELAARVKMVTRRLGIGV